MANANSKSRGTIFTISLKERPDFKDDLRAFVFDSVGNLLSQAPIKGSKVKIDLPPEKIARTRMFIAPSTETLKESPTILSMKRVNAYEAQVAFGDTIIEEIGVPGMIIDGWPPCGCLVRGKVVRSSDYRGVCGARVHICEVEKIQRWIMQLAPREVYRLRDDLIVIIRNPPTPAPGPVGPVINAGLLPSAGVPVPDLPLKSRPLYRFEAAAPTPTEGVPVPEPPDKTRPLYLKTAAPKAAPGAVLPHGVLSKKALGPQPIPPGVGGQLLSLPESRSKLETELSYATSTTQVQGVLADNWKMVGMLLCQLHERIWRLRCDEVAVVTTDNQGRFEASLSYPCVEDRPDYYFWVEYEFEAGYETVYEPSMACTTRWDYLCGSEVILPVSDPRVTGCTDYVDLPGCEVVVLTIGNNVAVQQIQTEGEGEGLTTADSIFGTGAPFGGTLEPRVDFSRSALRNKGIKFYRWSYKRLSGPDGESTSTADGSVPVSNDWTPLTRDVYRHYKDKDDDDKTIYTSYQVGPLPTAGGDRTAPKGNLFEIHPAYHPYYPDDPPHEDMYWVAGNPHIDLADAYFDTASLPGSPDRGPTEDEAAGRYELKLELFDEAGNLVNWTDKGIDLRIIDADAPFGTEDYDSTSAPPYNRLTKVGKGMGGLWGFRMVVRVDNNHCYAEVLPLAGDVEPDPECGFHTYESGYDVHLGFIARHPNHFATFGFNTSRATGPSLNIAATSGVAGESASNSYTRVDFEYKKFEYTKEVAVTDLLHIEDDESCANAAFGEHLDVWPMAQNGYDRLRYLHHEDTAAFALAEPCDREDEGQ